jgi:hypothetical protein
MTAISANPRLARYRGLQMLLAALSGAAFSYLLIGVLRRLGFNIRLLASADLAGFFLAVMFLLTGLAIQLLSFSPKWAGRQIEQSPDAEPASPRELAQTRAQAWVLLLAGVLLGIPEWLAGTGATPQPAPVLYGVILVLFALQTVLNLHVWRQADEFVRLQIAQVSMVSFWVGQGALFLAAAAEKLHLIHPVPLWDTCVSVLGIYFVASFIIAIRSRPAALSSHRSMS